MKDLPFQTVYSRVVNRLAIMPIRLLAFHYALTVGAVAAAMGVRMALTAWLGPGLPAYITFYPVIMAVALLGGFEPGLAATVVAAPTTAYWILPPVGRWAIASPVDRTGLVVFLRHGPVHERGRRKLPPQAR